MGSIAPIASQALSAFQIANNVISTVRPIANAVGRGLDIFDDGSDDLSLSQLEQQHKQEQKQAAQRAALEKQEILVKAQEAENKRRDALKRAVSRQRAQFGASGVSSQGGSSEAVLLGLFDESEQERASREQLDNLRFNAIDQNLQQQRRVNTLQREQLKQRQKISSTSSPLGAVKGFFDIF
ncbi:MAG: hypothetical protein HRT94_08345 [Alphaproteobacteria bacterium]|nr:hypothetical protein [Alphaproteobacteria bacterium]